MTDEEFNELPEQTRDLIKRIEEDVRTLMLDIGPLRAADLLKTISHNLRAVRFVAL